MKTMMKIFALVLAMLMVAGCFAGCTKDDAPATTEPSSSAPSISAPTKPDDNSEPPVDTKKEYTVCVKDADGNPVAGVLVQICKEGSTCFTPSRTNDDGVATWKLDEASDYYGTVSSLEEGMPKVYFENGFEVTLTYNPPVA
jgi:hypothetical protein